MRIDEMVKPGSPRMFEKKMYDAQEAGRGPDYPEERFFRVEIPVIEGLAERWMDAFIEAQPLAAVLPPELGVLFTLAGLVAHDIGVQVLREGGGHEGWVKASRTAKELRGELDSQSQEPLEGKEKE